MGSMELWEIREHGEYSSVGCTGTSGVWECGMY